MREWIAPTCCAGCGAEHRGRLCGDCVSTTIHRTPLPTEGITAAWALSAYDSPVGEAFNSKFVTHLRWMDRQGRFWAQWDLRRNGDQRDVALGTNPLGTVIPGFTVQNLRAGVRLFDFGGVQNGLNVSLTNLTDELYAESANASFFRPEPGRNLTVTWEVSF